jgi:hypothetical protein
MASKSTGQSVGDDHEVRLGAYVQLDVVMYGSGVGSFWTGPKLGSQRNGSRAARGTTHGEMVVAKFFAPNGPSGTYSHF